MIVEMMIDRYGEKSDADDACDDTHNHDNDDDNDDQTTLNNVISY